ncbi:MAG: hypothetical protein JNL98_23530 [Bryobacterales bacterium]|nr:hypothetical protein [Bryobacterales bacterium]
MKAVEFDTTVNRHGQIVLPQDVVGEIPPGGPVRVVLMWDASPTDSAWREAGRRKFEGAYCPEDSVYEQLVTNDSPDR